MVLVQEYVNYPKEEKNISFLVFSGDIYFQWNTKSYTSTPLSHIWKLANNQREMYVILSSLTVSVAVSYDRWLWPAPKYKLVIALSHLVATVLPDSIAMNNGIIIVRILKECDWLKLNHWLSAVHCIPSHGITPTTKPIHHHPIPVNVTNAFNLIGMPITSY